MPCRNCIVYFNPRPREGSDGITGVVAANMQIFQSTPPRGERRSICRSYRLAELFQSTPPRGERHTAHPAGLRREKISIHAPARGATFTDFLYCPVIKFQSTPPRGERRYTPINNLITEDFNPRPREGSDPTPLPPLLQDQQEFQSTPPRGERLTSTTFCTSSRSISIHAPARGATSFF